MQSEESNQPEDNNQPEENNQQDDVLDRQRSADQLRSFMKLRRNLRFNGYERPTAKGAAGDPDSVIEQRPNVERSSTWRYPVRRGPSA